MKKAMLPKRNINRKFSSTPARVSFVLFILLLIVILMPASSTYAADAVTISWNDVYQTIDGFGASGAFGQANSLKNMSEPARSTILDALFSQTSGAGLSIVRNIINDGRSGTTIEPSLNNWVWTGDADQIWLMQQAKSRGVNRFISTVWSPPAWMKDNNSAVGGSLAPTHYQDFADYLSRYAREYNSRFGLNIYAVSLANEPGVSVSYSSCNWTGAQFHDFIKNNLLPTFMADGVTAKVMIPEKAQWDETLANESLADDITAARVDIVGGHDYKATIPGTIAPFTNALSHNKPVWETEVSYFTSNVSNITDGLKWATQVHNFMVANTSAFLYWWLIEGDRSDGEALVQISGSSSYTLNKRLYTLGNYARFVRPDYVNIGSTEKPATNILTTAYRDPDSNKFVLVVINNNASSQTIDIVPDGFSASSLTPYVTDATHNLVQLPDVSLSGVTLAPSSVTTFVGDASDTGPTSSPTVSAISPTFGTTAGGTPVTITGSNFVKGAKVTIGGLDAAGALVNATKMTATTVAHAAGAVDVVVTNPDKQSATLTGGFTYVESLPVPIVSAISPTSGPSAGGTTVTVTGTNFTGATGVQFGGTAATDFMVNSDTSITATSPPGTGAVDVTVTAPGGRSATSSGDQFTYLVISKTVVSTTSGGTWSSGTAWLGGVAPSATDIVVIATTGANAVAIDANVSCAGLTINSGATLTLGAYTLTVNTGPTSIWGTINFNSATGTKTFNTDVTLNSGAVWNETAAAAMTFAGNFTNNATTFKASTGTHTFGGAGMMISGATTTSIPNVAVTGTYANSGILTVGTALSGAGRLTQGTTGILNIGGTFTINTLTATATGNTVSYTTSANQTVKATTYYNLTLSGSGTKTTMGVTVNGVLSMEGTAAVSAAPTYGTNATLQYNTTTARTTGAEWLNTFTATGGVIIKNSGGITLNAAKVFSNGIPLNIASTAQMFTANNNLTFGGDYINRGPKKDYGTTSTITINGTGTQNISGLGKSGTLINRISMTKASGTATFTEDVYATQLTINGSGGTLSLGSGVTINVTNVTLTAGTLDGASSTLNVSGTWGGTAGFTPGTGTVNYNGNAAQTVAAVTYNNLILSGGRTKSITSSSTSVAGNLSISSGVTVPLSTGINVQVKSLTLNAPPNVSSGTWGSTSSNATHKDSHFSGTGIITVG